MRMPARGSFPRGGSPATRPIPSTSHRRRPAAASPSPRALPAAPSIGTGHGHGDGDGSSWSSLCVSPSVRIPGVRSTGSFFPRVASLPSPSPFRASLHLDLELPLDGIPMGVTAACHRTLLVPFPVHAVEDDGLEEDDGEREAHPDHERQRREEDRHDQQARVLVHRHG
eukprot:CAMPEP_0198238720 /NCGR_PEP_ID=MMETSP1446-20131203/4312_1 /TAXON_ID=1461542 ORGANISM="Unidentified sp, Strain CCMP2111" /NCGR_SAMPLE_ID=MMETSP1446 /ASSEMBLY_ACC=CAM_ASM_001112 /LENGTH=168 /DNA_ID=CAMNT_0043921187 /DNA_START=77 /DNA_END=579 /DNA_ORIENTATION=-